MKKVHVEGAPDVEHLRSPAAHRIAELAEKSQLLLSHYEHRVRLPVPEAWLPQGRPDLEGEASWRAGVLPEPKYQAFRHDLLIGSFHPGHRAKWTAHELCHALVGFAYRPDATPFFFALGAWLAELLPVTLYYFLDEAGLRRCPRHAGGGPLYGTFCAACEETAKQGAVDDEGHERWQRQARAFMEAELAAVHRSVREGRVVSHRHATLDLGSDALAYAAGHTPRLRSPEFGFFAEAFFQGANTGCHDNFESLEARIWALFEDLCGGAPASPLAGQRWDYICQDLAFRLLSIEAECDDELREAMRGAVMPLVESRSEAGVRASVEAYRALFDAWELPPTEEVFAVGYDLVDGLGRGVTQVAEGLRSAAPRAFAILCDDGDPMDVARVFVREDGPVRAPIGRRFARFVRAHAPHTAADDLARLEAALTHPRAADAETDSLLVTGGMDDNHGEVLRLSGGVVLETFAFDVLEDTAAPLDEPLHLVVHTRAFGVDLMEVSSPVFTYLSVLASEGTAPPPEDPEVRASLPQLREAGVVVPARYGLVDADRG